MWFRWFFQSIGWENISVRTKTIYTHQNIYKTDKGLEYALDLRKWIDDKYINWLRDIPSKANEVEMAYDK